MSIIIRLQNLPWSANALDIRNYFAGLQIPEGGVHIVGGELGDAFIAFSTDEDARQAFLRTDGRIKSVQIKLMLSSRTEMQRVIEQARTQSMAAFMLPSSAPVSTPLPAAVPPVIPSAVPEIKRDSKERDSDKKRDRKRSRTRSKSRDRRDRSRDRKDRRHRDRSRSRSRDRRDRRRRDRSKSRNKSRDRDSRRKDRGKSPKRDEKEDNSLFHRDGRKLVPEIWASRTPQTLNIIPPAGLNEGVGILGAFPVIDPTKHSMLDNLGGNLQKQALNGFPGANRMRDPPFGIVNQQSIAARHQRESWPPANVVPAGAIPLAQRKNMLDNFGRSTDNFQNNKGPRDDNRRDFNVRENRERPNKALGGQFEGRNENNGRKSRFDDDKSPPVDSCISMEPFYGSYGDLRRFFNGLSINYRGIKVINDEVGKKTGSCFVQFRNAQFKNDALKMNGHKLNNVTIKIQHISDKMFDEAIDRYNPRMDETNGPGEDEFGRTRPPLKPYKNPLAPEFYIKDFLCLKVEDLPTFVKEQDILHIFSQHPLISLHLNVKPKGGTVAYVKFSSKEVAKLALEERSQHVVGVKPVTVKPCTNEEFDQVNKEQNDALNENKIKDIGTDCLSISRLPVKTNDRDISDFFSDIGVIPTKIHLMSTHLGFTGQAYCEFETKEEATRAASKQGTVLGQDTICVLPINRTEMEGILNNSLPHPGAAPGLPLAPGTPLPVYKPEDVPKSEDSIKPDPFVKPETLSKPEPLPEIKPLLPERIAEVPEPLSSPNNLPSLQLLPPIRPILPGRPPLMRGFDNSENGPRGESIKNTNGPRGGLDNFENFNGPRGNLDNFNGPQEDIDNFDNIGGPRKNFDLRDNLNNGPGGNDRFDEFKDQRGLPDLRNSINGPRGNLDHRENFVSRGGHGPRMSRFGQRAGSRFNDEGPRFNPRVEDGPRFNPRGGNDGPRFNRNDNNKGLGFNPHMDDGLLEEVPGCTVFMENVPYKAGTNEILDFFDGYNCTNNVSRRYNPNNTPSAEAKVTFYNPDDAFRAVRELHGTKIWGRSIFLRQA